MTMNHLSSTSTTHPSSPFKGELSHPTRLRTQPGRHRHAARYAACGGKDSPRRGGPPCVAVNMWSPSPRGPVWIG